MKILIDSLKLEAINPFMYDFLDKTEARVYGNTEIKKTGDRKTVLKSLDIIIEADTYTIAQASGDFDSMELKISVIHNNRKCSCIIDPDNFKDILISNI